MSEDRFEEFVQREAKAYNEPPELRGRDELFNAIVAAKNARPKTEDGRPKTSVRGRIPYIAWIGMAATLAIGVAIGKFALRPKDSGAPAVAAVSRDGTARRGTDTASTPYTQAANTELARAEALLTAYSASAPGNGMDRQLSAWARDILSNTRLLLDSPAADDPARKRLLQDLELVLVQMVQRSPTAGAGDERAHIDRSLDRTQVLTRLRSALPAARNN